MENLHQCNICCENFDKKKRTKITCCFCSFHTCRVCSETYILNNSTTNISCMNPNCKKEWTRQFVRSVFTFTFINGELKKHRENILFDQERALLPATQLLIEEETRTKNTRNEIQKIEDEIIKLKVQQNTLRNSLYPSSRQRNTTPHFIRGCSDSECRGFLNTNWKCGICEKTTCSRCHELIQEDVLHACEPEKVATAELIVSETKPCPNCRTNIFKIDGCNQMWCTQCHTPFDWRTGLIETNAIHNPHYYEWLRRNNNGVVPRNPNDNPCVDANIEINETFLIRVMQSLQEKGMPLLLLSEIRNIISDKLIMIVRNLVHLRFVEISKYTYNHEMNNQSLRMSYMKNKITEENFKTSLQKNDKRNQKNLEILNVLQLLHDTSSEIMVRTYGMFISSAPQHINENFKKTLDELSNIVNYVNECLKEIAKTYASKKIVFNNELGRIAEST